MTKPKPLTEPQLARLAVVGRRYRDGFMPSFRDQPALTRQLADLGLVEPRGGKVAGTGKVVHHPDAVPTRAGLEALAAIPGEDHDEFRARLAAERT